AIATLPARTEIATDRFHQAQLRAAEETLRVAAGTRRSYYRAVATLQVVDALSEAESTAQTTAKLAKEVAGSGALGKLDQARDDAFEADAATAGAAARQGMARARERLIRELGLLENASVLKLPRSLPALPKRTRSPVVAETEAVRRRPDLQIARIEVDALGKSYSLTKVTRFINLLEVSGISRTQRESGGAHGTGGG